MSANSADQLAARSAIAHSASRASHVPPGLIRDIDLRGYEAQDPYERLAALRSEGRVFFNLTYGPMSEEAGIWVLTRAEDIRTALQQPEIFSSQNTVGFSRMIGETWSLIPLELDPPTHSQFRAILNGIFSPNRMKVMEDGIRARAASLIDRIVGDGGCEFVETFGRPFPVSIFMQLMGLPEEHTDQFNAWEYGLLHSQDPAQQVMAARAIVDYLRALIAKRKVEPADDLTTFCVNARIEERPVTDDEIMGMCFLLFIAGLDTVAASLSLHFRHLAMNPADQARLRADPSLIPNAVEELLRRYAIVTSTRLLTRDVEFAGVSMKAGDRVLFSTILANLDPDEFERPMAVDLDRSPNRHVSFLYGAHRCIGSHLARRELVISMEEWLKRVPPFRIGRGREAPVAPGGLLSVHALPLEW